MRRLADVFDFVKNREKTPFSPRFSIDTYHFETARKALENGFDILNDIHGFDDPEMLALAKEHKDKPCIFMHHDDITGSPLQNTVDAVEQWLERKINLFEQSGLKLHNMIFDPGVGFGKTACQSLQILQNLEKFHRFGVRLLIGHSRKSFMKVFTNKPPGQKDTETLGISIKIAEKRISCAFIRRWNIKKPCWPRRIWKISFLINGPAPAGVSESARPAPVQKYTCAVPGAPFSDVRFACCANRKTAF